MSGITDIIIKYLHNTASISEIEELEQWVRASPENTSLFKDYVYKHENKLKALKQFEKEKAFKEFLQLTRTQKEYGVYLKWVAIAIIIILFVGLDKLNKMSNQKARNKEIPVKNNKILLTLGNGSKKVLKENAATFIVDTMGDTLQQEQNNSLIYNLGTAVLSRPRYHILEVPLGKTFSIQLSDGTIAWLNAGSSLRFPFNFHKKMKHRQVELNGEAFFDVVENENQPFIVNTTKVAVKVLGTSFNVCSYEEDCTIKTTLVEGSVTIVVHEDNTNSVTICPEDKTEFDKSSRKLNTRKVTIEKYTAWVKNRRYFENDAFHELIKQIECSYNTQITNVNKALGNIHFTGEFAIENVNELLKSLQFKYSF